MINVLGSDARHHSLRFRHSRNSFHNPLAPPRTRSHTQIKGLTPGKHGFHVHAFGDIYTQGCASTGGHYNPFNRTHAAPDAPKRHVGDLGNIEAGPDGVAKLDFEDCIITLCGRRTILGRGVVVHDGEDDLGLGGFPDSKTTGHAGNRTACGIM